MIYNGLDIEVHDLRPAIYTTTTTTTTTTTYFKTSLDHTSYYLSYLGKMAKFLLTRINTFLRRFELYFINHPFDLGMSAKCGFMGTRWFYCPLLITSLSVTAVTHPNPNLVIRMGQ